MRRPQGGIDGGTVPGSFRGNVVFALSKVYTNDDGQLFTELMRPLSALKFGKSYSTDEGPDTVRHAINAHEVTVRCTKLGTCPGSCTLV
jgi:hypothetical protein